MVTHYIYVLYFKGMPIYVGISANPGQRVYEHLKDYRFKNMGALRKTVECHVLEQYWVMKFLKRKHKLINELVTVYRSDH